MANVTYKTTKKGKGYYEIIVRRAGHPRASTRWYVPEHWSESRISQALDKFVGKFESDVTSGKYITPKEQKQINAAKENSEQAEKAKIKTVRQYGEEVFLPKKKISCSENTRAYYANALKKYVYPRFGDKNIQDITTNEIEAFMTELLLTDLSQSTITAVYISLGQIFTECYKKDIIDRNPMDKIEKPKRAKAASKDKELQTYSIEEIRHIMKCISQEPLKWQVYIKLLIDTGCRRGEACGLKWENVNFKENTIRIVNNLCYTAEQGVYEDAPKTASSRREIDIDPDLMLLMKKWRKEQSKDCMSEYVFTQDGRREPMHPQSPTRYFKTFGKKYGIEHFHPHALRHTFASIAITNGADIASVSEKLGHANKGITLKMYTHADKESMKRASKIFRDALKEA